MKLYLDIFTPVTIEIVFTHDLKVWRGFKQHTAIASKPPVALGKGRILDTQSRPAALDHMAFLEVELAIILVHVILRHTLGQTAHHKKSTVLGGNATGAVLDLLHFMLGKER